jgi:hypothetical protein
MAEERIALAAGDEILIGPATGTTTVYYRVEAEGPLVVSVRDGIEHRNKVIDSLRTRVHLLEASEQLDVNRIANAVVAALAEKLS